MDLRDVYWIGGAPGAGKSTVARGLVARYGLRLYDTDQTIGDHARRSTADQAPYLHRFMAMSMDERWVERTPEEMLETFHWFRGEGFELIVDDLRKMPDGPPVVAEGFRLLPRLVLAAGDQHKAIWLLPTPEFYVEALESRGSTWEIPYRTSDPDRARRNLAERNRLFVERLGREAAESGVRTLRMDGTRSVAETIDLVAGQWEGGMTRR
jgi:adenylate kinase family enzyme